MFLFFAKKGKGGGLVENVRKVLEGEPPPNPVPEPASSSLLTLGLLALLGYMWRKRRQAGLQLG